MARGAYRYLLTRRWGLGPAALFVMLNPSTADDVDDDPTIRRCVGFARRWRLGGLEVVNLYALRATDPRDLFAHRAPVGRDNDDAISDAVARAAHIVVAWGVHGLRDPRRVARVVDLRYHGQSHELSVPVPSGPLTPTDVTRLRDDFHAAHERAYGYAAREDAIEMVNVRLTAIGVSPKPRRAALVRATDDGAAAVKGERLVWFGEASRFVGCRVVDRARLAWGHVVVGPAAIEEMDATTLVHPGWQAEVDEHGNLLLRRLDRPEPR